MPRETPARRLEDIAPFQVMEILARIHELEAEGRSIIHMEIGEPDFPTAAPVLAAGQEALINQRTRYTSAAGIPALRQAISHYYRDHYQVTVTPERIFVTPGASGALQLATAVLVNPGDRVLLSDPGYPCNRHFVRLAEGIPVGIPVGPNSAYQLDPTLLDEHWDATTRAALLATPANPTGTVVGADDLRAMLTLARQRNGHLIVDEIYHGLQYDQPTPTALAAGDDLFVVNSFSKYFGMTGWRLGWLVVPEAFIRSVNTLAQNLFIAASTPAQYAALAAFTPEALTIFEERRRAFQERRDFLVPALRDLGFKIPVVPPGAFYLYADCSRFSTDSFAFARQLLEEVGVAATPGIDFGAYQAERHIRFAYTTGMDQLQEAVRRLQAFLAA